MSGGWLASAKEAVITPASGLPMAGYGSRHGLAQGAHDDLYARVLALSTGGSPHLSIHLDVLWITPLFRRIVERELVEAIGEEPSWALVATHTHGGPELDDRTLPWLQDTAEAIARLARVALETLVQSDLVYARCEVEGIAVNRRSGHDLTDPDVLVLAVHPRGSSTPAAVVANVTCHPVVLGPSNRRYTGDYPAFMYERIREVYGPDVVPLFSCGAAGDINTGHTAEASAIGEFIPNRTFDRARRIGRTYADAVLAALVQASTPVTPRLEVASAPFSLPYRSIEDEATLATRIANLDERIGDGSGPHARSMKIERMYCEVLRGKRRERDEFGDVRPTVLQALLIGNTRHLFVPGELFVALGLRLKDDRAGTFVHGYANDYVGYLPTESAWHEGGYEQVACPYPASTSEALTSALGTLARDLDGRRRV